MRLTTEQESKLRALFQEVTHGLLEEETREQVIEGRTCSLAFFRPAQPATTIRGLRIPAQPRRLIGAISKETYEANRQRIEEIRAEVMREARQRELEASWVTLALADQALAFCGKSWETGLGYFQLRPHLPPDIWAQVSRFFQKVQAGGDEEAPVSGWVVIGQGAADEVRAILRQLAEAQATEAHRAAAQRLLERKRAEAQRAAEAEAKRHRQAALLEEIEEAFRQAERPQASAGLLPVTGEEVSDPSNPPNIYGGGRWFVIQPQEGWIWMITNNGADGDDWSLNNVATGGAGAIGVRVPYSEALAEKIRALGR